MRIRFKDSDPRRGQVVEIEAGVGRMHIASGAAEEVAANTPGQPAKPSVEQRALVRRAANPRAAKTKRPEAPAAKRAARKAAKAGDGGKK